MTLMQASELTGIEQARLASIERGVVEPSGDEVLIIADVYGEPVEFFITNERSASIEKSSDLWTDVQSIRTSILRGVREAPCVSDATNRDRSWVTGSGPLMYPGLDWLGHLGLYTGGFDHDAASSSSSSRRHRARASACTRRRPDRGAGIVMWSAAELEQRNTALSARIRPDGSAGETLADYGNPRGAHRFRFIRRNADGVPEQHAHIEDVLFIQSGAGTLVVGGERSTGPARTASTGEVT